MQKDQQKKTPRAFKCERAPRQEDRAMALLVRVKRETSIEFISYIKFSVFFQETYTMLYRILDMTVLTYLTGSALQPGGRLSTPNKMTGDLFLLSLRKVHTPSNESFLEKFKIQRKRYHNYIFALSWRAKTTHLSSLCATPLSSNS